MSALIECRDNDADIRGAALCLGCVESPQAMTSILFIVPELLPVPPTEGGAVEHWVHEVSQRMAHAGHDVAVISRPAATAGDPNIAYIGVPWTRLGRWWLKLKQTRARRNPLRNLAKLANVLGYAMGVRRAMRDVEADIVYVHNDPLLAWLLPIREGQKLVQHMHNDHLSVVALRPLLGNLLSRTDLVLCVSDFIRDRARKAFPAHAARMQTMLNATDTALFRPYPEAAARQAPKPAAGMTPTFHFLYVGRLTADKGVHVLIDAFARVHHAYPHTRLLIAGSSFFANAPLTDYQRQLALQAAPLAHAIVFSGFVPHAQLRFMYADADTVVVPSTWQEPFGLVALEAMSSQSCVIASAVGGMPELVTHERTGLLVPPDDAAALAEAMARVVQDPALRHRLALAGRHEALTRFSYTGLASELDYRLGGLMRARAAVAHTQWPKRASG